MAAVKKQPKAKTEQILTFKMRVYPTRKQHERLQACLDHTRQLYNAALEEWLAAYEPTAKARKQVVWGTYTSKRGEEKEGYIFEHLADAKASAVVTFKSQSKGLTELRKTDQQAAGFPRRVAVWPLQQLHASIRAMFARHKKGERISPPRFRGWEYWTTLGTSSAYECRMSERGIVWRKFFGGTLRIGMHRPLPSFDRCKSFTLSRDGRRWFIHLTYGAAVSSIKRYPSRPVGLDLGMKTAVMRSDGVAMHVPASFRPAEAELRCVQRHLQRCEKRSRRRLKAKAQLRRVHAKIARKRRHHAHKIAARITHHFDAVAVENLNLKGLTRMGGGGAKGRGYRSKWRDIAPGKMVDVLAWNCQRDGRPFVKVDPRATTIDCSACGERVEKALTDRTHHCPACGLIMDRDENAAINVLNRGGLVSAGAKLGNSPACPRNTSPSLSTDSGTGIVSGPPSPTARNANGPPEPSLS